MNKKKLEDYFKITDFDIKLNRNIVFHIIDCHQDSPIFEEVNEEYDKLEAEVYRLAEPAALVKFGKSNEFINTEEALDEASVVYVLMTIGDRISQLSSQYFSQGDYLTGMLINAMADEFLFQMENPVQSMIREECAIRHLGVKQRLEAPGSIPMEIHKVILEETKAAFELNMGITEGYMFTTVKTNAYVLVLTRDDKYFNMQHNCSECEAVNCKMRKQAKVNIKVLRGSEVFSLECSENESIMETIIRQGIYISSVCGGKGTCGKCRLQVIEGKLDITEQDKIKLTDEELLMGYRLSCRAFPKEDCTIRLIGAEESDFEVVSAYQADSRKTKAYNTDLMQEDNYVIGIDIGTTTLAMNLVDLKDGKIVKTYTALNKQRAYGADVISRIKASNDGKKELLQESIRNDLLQGIDTLIEGAKINSNKITKIVIAGNTTMGHLLMGYSCETLGVYPYTPVNISRIELRFSEIFASDILDVPVVLLPGISTYVGGDIVAGLLTCGFDKTKAPCMLIDLGTNGEMAIGNMERILVCSTAAGPAFEGGNISCGVGSIAGAICNVVIENNKVGYQTIGNKAPIGICGTGVIEIASELLKEGLMDETGLLNDDNFEGGYEITPKDCKTRVILTQRDIREIQLAKAAVRAGIDILLKRYGITYAQLDTVYLAGGFGYKVDIDKAIHIGLLPKEFGGKIKTIGNSSLAGAVQYLTDDNAFSDINKIVSIAEEISLSKDKDFNDLYVGYMYFE